jgi:integrase
MKHIPFERLRAEVLSLNEPPLRARATWFQVRQILQEFADLPGIKRASDLTPVAIANWIKAHPERTPVRTNSLLRTFSGICSYAVSAGYLGRSPFGFRKVSQWVRADVIAPDRPQPQRHRSAEDIERVLRLLDHEAAGGSWKGGRLQAIGYLVAFTGVRKKEAIFARPWDVDLDRRWFEIRTRRENRLKTLKSAERLPLADPVIEVMRLWIPRCGGEWLFPGVRLTAPWIGGSPGYRALDELATAAERAGVPGLTFLGLRKCIGTLAKSWGLGPLEVQSLLRHTSVQTQKWYDEEKVESLRPAVSKIRYGPPVLPGPPPAAGGAVP